MSDASSQVASARVQATFLGALLLGWLVLGGVAGVVRLMSGPPLTSPFAWLSEMGREAPASVQIQAPANAPAAEPPAIQDESRIYSVTQLEMLSPDTTRGRPQGDIRTYAAYSDVGYYIEFDNAQDDTIRVEVLNNGQVASSCAHPNLYGRGSRNCRFPAVAPGSYQIRVAINGQQTSVLAFIVQDGVPQTFVGGDDLAAPEITNPQWIERPRGRDLVELYPSRAEREGREGRVVLDCIVRADGRVQCSVVSEDPVGWGFGEASIRASQLFRMSPQLEDGKPSEGGRVRVPMTWRLED